MCLNVCVHSGHISIFFIITHASIQFTNDKIYSQTQNFRLRTGNFLEFQINSWVYVDSAIAV
jgi:hypothetical protein